jgi:hypothetical protein
VPVEARSDVAFEEALVARILASRHFAKAPLLSAFLSYVCHRSLREKASRISEREIGTNVFGRELGYDAREDNIVRNYARQLRRRLDDYYATDGLGETLRIQIPKGGYVPLIFKNDGKNDGADYLVSPTAIEDRPDVPEIGASDSNVRVGTNSKSRWPWMLASAVLGVAVLICGIALLRVIRRPPFRSTSMTTVQNSALWEELFSPNRDTLIVPSDTAFVTLEDMHERTYSLSAYVGWSSVEYPVPGFEEDLRTRKYTSVVDLETISRLARLPEWRPERALVRSSRNLRIEDLKEDNVILLGSVYSIPWIALLENELDFKFDYKPKEKRAWIENQHPKPGEAPIYFNHWNGLAETDYAVIALVPNLNRTGHILLLEGLDGAGTDAAEDMLFRSEELRNLLAKTRRADGTLGGLEVLLESSSLDSHSTSGRIVSVHTLN